MIPPVADKPQHRKMVNINLMFLVQAVKAIFSKDNG
jgi:hypothetical protein